MDISFTHFLLGLLLLIVPVGVIRIFEIPLMSRLMSAVARMAVFTAVAAALMYVALRYDNVWLNILIAIIFVMISALMVLWRARLNVRIYILPISLGLLSAVVFIGICVLLLTAGGAQMANARFLIPVAAILSASSVVACADALSVYYAGLRHHNQLYYYLLGNGATHTEALYYLMRRALQRSLLPGMARMSALVLMASPVAMWMMVMAGTDVFTAAALQILLMVAVSSTSTLSVLVALYMAGRYVTDDYGRLKNK